MKKKEDLLIFPISHRVSKFDIITCVLEEKLRLILQDCAPRSLHDTGDKRVAYLSPAARLRSAWNFQRAASAYGKKQRENKMLLQPTFRRSPTDSKQKICTVSNNNRQGCYLKSDYISAQVK
jgi:hypothetical protein